MWRTSEGDRTLEGAEARLFAEVLWGYVSSLEATEGDCCVGPEAFDRLTYGQKVFLLSIIGNGLLKPDVPVCELTAGVEAAVAAVFEYLRTVVTIEIDEPKLKSNWRKLILAACRQIGAEDLPNAKCRDEEEWDIQIEGLSCLILWDCDFSDEDLYIDKSPEEATSLKDFMGINAGYFREVPEDLNPKKIETRLSELKTLCRLVCKKSACGRRRRGR